MCARGISRLATREEKEDADFSVRGEASREIRYAFLRAKKKARRSLSLSPNHCATTHSKKKKKYQMGKTGTEKPLKAPKKKQKELDEDDLAALARKKEEQAKLNALKKQVAGGAKLGKGMSKSK